MTSSWRGGDTSATVPREVLGTWEMLSRFVDGALLKCKHHVQGVFAPVSQKREGAGNGAHSLTPGQQQPRADTYRAVKEMGSQCVTPSDLRLPTPQSCQGTQCSHTLEIRTTSQEIDLEM